MDARVCGVDGVVRVGYYHLCMLGLSVSDMLRVFIPRNGLYFLALLV